MIKYIFTVEGMKCSGCSTNVEKALAGVDGIKQVDVDVDNKMVTIIGDIDTNKIEKLISDSGYPAMLVE